MMNMTAATSSRSTTLPPGTSEVDSLDALHLFMFAINSARPADTELTAALEMGTPHMAWVQQLPVQSLLGCGGIEEDL